MKLSLAGLSKFDFLGVLFLRLGTGALIAFHGFPLLVGGTDSYERIGGPVGLIGITGFHLFFGLASAVIQTIGGVFLVLGILTRGNALLLTIITGFAIANLMQHTNGFDISLLFHFQISLALLSLVFIGPGRISLDRKGI